MPRLGPWGLGVSSSRRDPSPDDTSTATRPGWQAKSVPSSAPAQEARPSGIGVPTGEARERARNPPTALTSERERRTARLQVCIFERTTDPVHGQPLRAARWRLQQCSPRSPRPGPRRRTGRCKPSPQSRCRRGRGRAQFRWRCGTQVTPQSWRRCERLDARLSPTLTHARAPAHSLCSAVPKGAVGMKRVSERTVLPLNVQSPSPVCGRASECAQMLVGWVVRAGE